MTKEEKKDEMKNRISMALKDPILQQGFEIICKNLTDLEKENKKAKQGCHKWFMRWREVKREELEQIADIKANCDLAIEGRDVKIKELEEENNKLLDVINNQDVKIADLEKKNAELKELIEKYRQAVDKCLHITFMGAGCEVNTIGQYAILVDGYLTGVEGLAKWKN